MSMLQRRDAVTLRCFECFRPGGTRSLSGRIAPQKPWQARRRAIHAQAHPAASAPATPQGRQGRPGIVHTSLYLPEALYEGLREAAFRERCKIHDILLEGIKLALRKRGWRK
jgi:hypothetical protein